MAERTKAVLDGFRFDKQHTLAIDFFTDFEKYVDYAFWQAATKKDWKLFSW